MTSVDIQDRLRRVLVSTWDPLCVGDNAKLADEYDRYIPMLLSLLQTGGNQGAIAAALQKIEKDEFGMELPSPGIERAAAEICALRLRR